MHCTPLHIQYRSTPGQPLLQRAITRTLFWLVNAYLDYRKALDWEFDSIWQFHQFSDQIKSIDTITFSSVIVLDKHQESTTELSLEVIDFTGKLRFRAQHKRYSASIEEILCRAMSEDHYRIAQDIPYYESVEITGSYKNGVCYAKYVIRDDESTWQRNRMPQTPSIESH